MSTAARPAIGDRTGSPAGRAAVSTAVVDTAEVLVEQWVAAELGNSSYAVVDRATGDAVLVDPTRDVDRFLGAGRDWRVIATVDTHVHNDYLSGGADIRAACGAQFIVPAGSGVAGADRELSGGDEVTVGSLRLRAIHSPGHTPEHLSYLLIDDAGEPLALFSGGALMVGTMARPDLLGAARVFALSRAGRRTLRDTLLALPDELCVLPTHGGGSFCGSSSSSERTTTIGRERAGNPLATAPDLAHFLAIHAKQGRYPTYYRRMAALNRQPCPRGAGGAGRLDLAAFDEACARGAAVVDCRDTADFDAGHIPGSLAVPVDGPFSAWVGWVIDIDAAVAIVAGAEAEANDAIRQLQRIGFSDVTGWLPFDDWRDTGRPLSGVVRCTIADLAERILDGEQLTVVDVRQDDEWASGHLPGAIHAMAPDIPGVIDAIERAAPVAVHCATGYRAALGVSMLLRLGFSEVLHVIDGVDAWAALGHPLVTAA